MKSIVALITIILLSFSARASVEDAKVIIASDHWCPYTCDSRDKEHLGFSVDLIREALKLGGRDTAYINAPFLRVNHGVTKGTFHILPATLGSSSPDLHISKEPVAYQRNVFVVKRGTKWRYEGLESLGKVAMGVIAGYTYSPEIDEYIKANNKTTKVQALHSNQAQEQNLRKLMAGRIDAYLEDENVVRFYANKLGLAGEVETAGFAYEFPIFCGFGTNDKAKELAETLDNGIRKLQKTETMKKLVEKYRISNWR